VGLLNSCMRIGASGPFQVLGSRLSGGFGYTQK
jgi:hypothetical protein